MGIRLVELRLRARLTQERLSTLIGLSPAQLDRVENGLDQIEADVLSRLCVALGVEPISFFTVDGADADRFCATVKSPWMQTLTARPAGPDNQYLSRLKEAFSKRASALVH